MPRSQTHQTSSGHPRSACPGAGQHAFRLGTWRVDPEDRSLSDGETRIHLQALPMRVLCYLCAHADRAVGRAELVREVWQVSHVSEHAVHNTISTLRQALGDSVRAPRYIRTERLAGYRIIGPLTADATEPALTAAESRQWRFGWRTALLITCAAITGLFLIRREPAPTLEDWLSNPPQNWEVEVTGER
ncbi:winged helix-turn-helix domain-containing protein [Maricaulis virginensis]|nr:winged helix-turn-helix domain-containing protein [Maricaulis virginensis]